MRMARLCGLVVRTLPVSWPKIGKRLEQSVR
jgi:hypothetical protein